MRRVSRRPAPVSTDEGRDARATRRTTEWTIVAALALVATVLGYIGFAQLYAGEGYRPTELLYRSLQLFVFESGAVQDTSPPAALEIARLLAPAVAAYAAIRAVILLFREQLALLGIRLLRSEHVVVVGLSQKGFALAKALHRRRRRVVVIERDPANPFIAGCREREIPVLVADAADAEILAKAGVAKAAYLVVAAGDDATNVDIAFTAAELAVAARPRALTAFVHVDDLGLWRVLQPHVLALRARLPFRIEFFNLEEAAARAMLERQPPFQERHASPHALVVGPGRMCESVVLYAATMSRRSEPPSEPVFRMTLVGEGAASSRTRLLARYPGLGETCDLGAWEGELTWTAQVPGDLTAAYVCCDDEAAGLAAAIILVARSETRDVPVVLVIDDDRSGLATALQADPTLERARLFGVLPEVLAPELLLQGTNELIAQAKHEHYVMCELERGFTSADNPSLVPWHELDESLKESNRLFADSVGAKLEDTGCVLVPAPLSDPAAPGFAFADAEIEELGRAEHDRWCSDLIRHGWRWGPTKDPVSKRHPSLVPWRDLSEEERDKDRDPVRELPRMLARVGFRIQRVGRAPEPSVERAVRT